MRERLIVVIVGAPLLLAVLLLAPPWAAAVMCALLSGVACWELMHAVGREKWRALFWLPLVSAATALVMGLELDRPDILGILAALSVAGAFLTAIFRYGGEGRIGLTLVLAGLFGAFAIPAAFSCLALLRCASPVLSLTPLVGAFMSDTGGYFAGRFFGKRKLAPNVSPNKTVEGCVGGFVGSILGMYVLALVARWAVRMTLGWWLPLLLGVLGSLFGQIGDLSFSVIKREYGIKDYSRVFAGHGGVLDRFDSVIFVAPVYCLLFGIFF